jgi:DNA-binding transcriptional ArsR family regulator
VDADYTRIGRLLSSSARSAMLGMLFEGQPVPAGALARRADVAPSTASEHLRALVDGGLVAVVAAGRQRHYRIASAEIAEALEALGRVCPRAPVRSLRASQESAGLAFARTCYDHLAGRLGVAVLDGLLAARWLTDTDVGFELGPGGARFAELGVDARSLETGKRRFARRCLDATERRPHLAGALGAAMCGAMLDRTWFVRSGHGRGLRLTPRGSDGLSSLLDIDPTVLTPTAT